MQATRTPYALPTDELVDEVLGLALDAVRTENEESLIESQRQISENVASLKEQMARVVVSHGTSIDNIDEEQFQLAGPKARQRAEELVSAARSAHEVYVRTGVLGSPEALAIVEETVEALMNSLMLSAVGSGYFGVLIPPKILVDMNKEAADWHDQAIGLLVYRAWQLILRTPEGREILAVVCDYAAPDSYGAICGALAGHLRRGTLPAMFARCVSDLPVSKHSTEKHARISADEKRNLLASVKNKSIVFSVN
jgi:hypothetical protein